MISQSVKWQWLDTPKGGDQNIHFPCTWTAGTRLIARRRSSGAWYNFMIIKRAMWKRFLRSHVNAISSVSREAALNALSRYTRSARGISRESSVGGCNDIAKQAKGIHESGARILPTPTFLPLATQRLHYDEMHNARWVRRRAVCASYIAMADGRDSKKDFLNRISSPRTAYIFHDRGRANRLPLLSSIFYALRDISRLRRIDVDEWERFAELESWIVETGWKIRAEAAILKRERYIV